MRRTDLYGAQGQSVGVIESWGDALTCAQTESLRGRPHLCENTGSFDHMDLSNPLLIQIRVI